ncbi:MAG: tetratricopeptide repeat protein, partial [Methanoculleus sp.]
LGGCGFVMGRSRKKSDSKLDDATMLLKDGDYSGALAVLDESLKLDPMNAGIWCHKLLALCALDRSEEAIECYDRALELHAAWGHR